MRRKQSKGGDGTKEATSENLKTIKEGGEVKVKRTSGNQKQSIREEKLQRKPPSRI